MTTTQRGPLTARHQLMLLREFATRTMGQEYVDRLWSQLEPVLRDKIGHGDAVKPGIIGDADDPKHNYWKGVWQVHHAE